MKIFLESEVNVRLAPEVLRIKIAVLYNRID